MGAALKLKNHGLCLRKNAYTESSKEITLLYQLTFALDSFYKEPCTQEGKAPNNWNPIFLHYYYGVFDPYMVGSYSTNTLYNSGKGYPFKPWNDQNGLERTKLFLQEIKEKMESTKYHIELDLPNRFIGRMNGYEDYILSTHYVTTREMVTHKTIIIGFFHLATGTYKRYLIKDVKKLCKLLRVFNGDFRRLLGLTDKGPGYVFDFDPEYNKNLTKEELDKRILQLVSDASSIPVTNEHVLEMLKTLKKYKDNIYYL